MNEPDTQLTSDDWKPLQWEDVSAEKLHVISALIDQIPDLPVHVQKILKIVSDIDTNAKEIAQLASSDPVLATKILNVVNSSYYGFSKKVEDLQLAIVLLGHAEIRTLALQTAVSKSFGKDTNYQGYDTSNLWVHSYQVSLCAEALAKKSNPKVAGEYLTLGLLHDIGKFMLYNIAIILKQKGMKPKPVGELSPHCSILEKEEHLFGVNHTIVGSMIARKWNLTDRIISVIQQHHYPSYFTMEDINPNYRNDITSICMADCIVHTIHGHTDRPPDPPDHFIKMLRYSPPLNTLITDDLTKKLRKARSFLTYIQ